MIGFKKQKFCDFCDMPIEDCECEPCENCNELPNKCSCEVCDKCNNFIEYCECLEKAKVNNSTASFCIDCGMHTSECECGTENNDKDVCNLCGNNQDDCICDSTISTIDETQNVEVDEQSEVIVIEEPPSFATKMWRAFMTLLIIIMTISTLVVFYFVYDTIFKEPEQTNLTVEQKSDLATDILTMMYDVRDVQDIINNQESIMSKITPELYPKLDVSNEQLYLRRYGSFSNSSTTIDFNSYTKTKSDNQIILNYTIHPVADMPVQRMAIMEFSMDKKLIDFIEYTVNEIK